MHITILCLGSRGDVFPYVALGAGLRAAGAEVRLVASANFQSIAQQYELDFHPFQIDSRVIMHTAAGRALASSGDNIVRAALSAFRSFGRLGEQYVADLSSPTLRNTDAILNQLPGSVFGYDLAELLGIPHMIGAVIPMTPTAAFPMTGFPRFASWLPGYNRLTYTLAEQVLWQFFRRATNRWRQETLGLQPAPLWGHYRNMRAQGQLVLNGFSKYVVPRPADWGDNVHLTGYWFMKQQEWDPPQGLLRFIEQGHPPVFVGFGSMTLEHPQATLRVVAEALERVGARAVVSSGWGGLSQEDLPEYLHPVDFVPYRWLFPRVAAVVHHGGSGTTAAGLRAGVPSILIPFVFDQFYWGDRLHQLGVSPEPIPHQRLNAASLAAALDRALGDVGMRRRASDLAERIRGEDGIGAAVGTIMLAASS